MTSTPTPSPAQSSSSTVASPPNVVAPCAVAGDAPLNAPLSLSDFKRVEMAVTGDLKCLRDYASEFKLDKTVSLIDDILLRMGERGFSIAVVGEFKRGKSTVINALLGKDILPSDIMPCSATLNRVTYGVTPRVRVFYKDGHQDEVSIDELTNYVTKLTEESEELASKVAEAVVEYPVPYCQNNVDIIDTPGLNDDESMTNVTLGVLPSVDAAILVIMAQSPFSEYERDFVENKLLSSDMGRVLFLVSAIDRLNNEGDADRLIESVRARIKRYVMQRAKEQFGQDSPEFKNYLRKIGEPRVFGVSAYQALQAKVTGDGELLKKSRFAEFEQGLERFLSEDRGTVLLQVPINRIVSAASEVLNALSMREAESKMSNTQFESAFKATTAKLDALRAQKVAELGKVSTARDTVEKQIAPLCEEFDLVMKAAVREVISGETISPDDASDKKKKATSERIGKKVAEAIQMAAQKHAEKIQNIVDAQVETEKGRLQEFGSIVDKSLADISMQFTGQAPTDNGQAATKTGTYIADALAVVTLGMGGGLSGGYREGGLNGALLGGAVGGATWLTGLGMASMLIPGVAALPVLIGLGFAGAGAARWATRQVFGAKTVLTFRQELVRTFCVQIDAHVKQTNIEKHTFDLVKSTFGSLSRGAGQEIEAALTSTEKTLDELRLKRERNETLDETQQQRFQSIRQKTQNILAQAQNLNDQLTKQVAGV